MKQRMKRLPNKPTQHGDMKELKQLARDQKTVNILHGLITHSTEDHDCFQMRDIQLFAMKKHTTLCIENPKKGKARPCEKGLIEGRRPEKLRYEATRNRLSRLVDLGMVQKIVREGEHAKYRVSSHVPQSRRGITSEDEWLLGFVPEIFRKMLMRMDYCSGGVRRLHYFPVAMAREKVPETEMRDHRESVKKLLQKGILQYKPGPPIALPKRSQIWMFAPTRPSVPDPWMGDGKAPETGSPIDVYDNFGYFFETFLSKALDDVCPDGWVILVCSRSLWHDTLLKGLDEESLESIRRMTLYGKIENLANELQVLKDTDDDVGRFLDPWFHWLENQTRD